jgi:superfamily II helicase
MITPLTENPAVVDPQRTLSSRQKDALSSIAFYRHQRINGGHWQVGNKRFSTRLVNTLLEHNLIQHRGPGLALTTAGEIVAEKLKRGGAHGSA